MNTSVADHSAATSLHRRVAPLVRLSPQFVNRICARISRYSGEQTTMAGLLFGMAGTSLLVVQAFKCFPDPGGHEKETNEVDNRDAHFIQSALAPQSDPEVSALDLIGWYGVRENGGLSADDLNFHNSHFSEPNDLALILTRQDTGNVLVEIYTRGNGEALSDEDYYWGAIRLSVHPPVIGPVEIPLRASSVNDEKSAEELESPASELGNEDRKRTYGTQRKLRISIMNPWRRPLDGTAAAQGQFASVPEQDSRGAPREQEAAIVRGPLGAPLTPQPGYEPMELARVNAGAVPMVPALWNALAPPPRMPWISSAVICAVAATATFGFLVLRGLPPDSAPPFLRPFLVNTGLALRVEGQGDRVLLSWNRRNAIVRSASEGILHIDDGSQHRDVRLDADQVENGLVLYRPGSNDVTFRLEIHGQQGDSIGETVRVLDGTHNALQSNTNASPILSHLSSPPIAKQSLSAPPDLENSVPLGDAEFSQSIQAPIPKSTDAPSASPGDAGAPPKEIPANAALTSGFVPPHPTHQVLPDTRLLSPSALQTAEQVEVIVEIDKNGFVRSAQLAKRKKNMDRTVSAAAISAAKMWTFNPAMFHGRRVASYHTIIFQFQHQ